MNNSLRNTNLPVEEDVDIKRFFQLMFQHRYIIIIAVCLFLILGFIYYTRQSERYFTRFGIHFDDSKTVAASGNIMGNYISRDANYWDRVMNTNDIYLLVKEIGGFEHSPHHIATFFSISRERSTRGVGGAIIFLIDLTTNSPDIILPLTNSFVKALNTKDKYNQYNSLKLKHEYLLNQLALNKSRQDSIETVIAQFSGLLELDNIKTSDQLFASFDRLRTNIKEAEVELAYISALRINTERELHSLRDTLFEKASFTEPLKVQLMNLHVQLARALTKYGEEHPVVIGVRKNIDLVEAMLSDGFEQNVTIQSIQTNPFKQQLMHQTIELKIKELSTQVKIEAMNRVVGEYNTNYSSENQQNNIFKIIRDRDEVNSRMTFLHKELLDTELAMHWTPQSFHLMEQPDIPLASKKRPIHIVLLFAFMLGLIIGIGLVILYDFIDDSFKLVSDFEMFFFPYPLLALFGTGEEKVCLKVLKDRNMRIFMSHSKMSLPPYV